MKKTTLPRLLITALLALPMAAGAQSLTAEGKYCLSFDGQQSYADAPQMLSALPQATLMAWVKLDATFTGNGFVMGQENFEVRIVSGGGQRHIVINAGNRSIQTTKDLIPGKWYHITAIADGPYHRLALIVNGSLETECNDAFPTAALGNSVKRFTMGRSPEAVGSYLKASVDEVRVFDAALDLETVREMVYQEIIKTGDAVTGAFAPRSIENAAGHLLAYYRMDAIHDNTLDDDATPSVETGNSNAVAHTYHIAQATPQSAPMPFKSQSAGMFDTAMARPDLNAQDLRNAWAMFEIAHNVTLPYNLSCLAIQVNNGAVLKLTNDNKLESDWYLKLDGTIKLTGHAQLVQTDGSQLDATGTGSIERSQQGQSNIYNYNYWTSPVIATGANPNLEYTVNGVLRDGTLPDTPQAITWTDGLDGMPTAPITLSGFWIFKFQNMSPVYANWGSVGPYGTLTAGQGFTLKGSGASTATQRLTFVGKPNNGDINVNLSPGNLNLTGNPYPSALDADRFIKENIGAINGTLYFWEHFATNTTHMLTDYQGGYATRNLVGGTPAIAPAGYTSNNSSRHTPGRFIPVGQGFFVVGKIAGNVTFRNAQRAFVKEENSASAPMFRQPMDDVRQTAVYDNADDSIEPDGFARLRIGFEAGDYHRQVLLGFMDQYADGGLNAGYDAENIDTQPNDCYLMNAGKKLVISGEGYFNANANYSIGVKSTTAQPARFTLDNTENWMDAQPVYLYDANDSSYHDLRLADYVTTVSAGTDLSRFSLKFTNPNAPLSSANFMAGTLDIRFTGKDNVLNIKNEQSGLTVNNISLFDLRGHQVARWNVAEQDQTKIAIAVQNLQTGAYVAHIETNNGAVSKKIMVQ